MKKLRILISALLCINIFCIITIADIAPTMLSPKTSLSSNGAVAANNSLSALEDTAPDGYRQVSHSDCLILYSNLDNGLFAVKNRKTGYVWYSTPSNFQEDGITRGPARMQLMSQIYISYIYKSDETIRADVSFANSQAECVENDTVTVKQIDNGIRVEYFFQDLGIKIPVEYTLHDDYFEASVKLSEIDEGDQCFIKDIYVLPSFGAGYVNDTGYLFVPDGCGALVDFSEHTAMTNAALLPVYGAEKAVISEKQTLSTEDVHMPVFGTVIGSDALMGIITQGDGSSSVLVTYHDEYCGYSAVCPVVNYRTQSQISLFKSSAADKRDVYNISRVKIDASSFTTRYYMLSGGDASYVGMANQYRSYLIKEKGLKKNPLPPSFQIEMYGMADISSSFFGFNYVRKQKLTTYSQAADIISAMHTEGMKDLSLRYVGWANNGILNNEMISKAGPAAELGGSSGWNQLVSLLKKINTAFYPDLDLIRFRAGGDGVNAKRDSTHTSFGRIAYRYQFLPSVFTAVPGETPIMLLGARQLPITASKVLSSYSKLKLDGVGLGTLGNYLYSDLKVDTGLYRDGFESTVTNILKKYKSAGLSVGADTANAYTYPYTDCIWNMPLYSSGYDIYSTDVPFYQLVLHGYITLTTPPVMQSTDPQVTFLKAVETGSELLYSGMYEDSTVLSGTRYDNLYGTTYTLWLKRAASQYSEIMPLLKKVYDKEITAHKEIANGVFMTTYENGISTVVNYNDYDVLVEKGVTCKAKDFIVL